MKDYLAPAAARREGVAAGVPQMRAPSRFKLLIGGFVSMATFDFTPYRRSTVGFDRLFDLLENQVRTAATGDNYPPFNIERRGEDAYRITLAIAGFRPEDLDITAHQNLLVIQGRKRDEATEGEMLHIGIANRGFERRFELADFVRVDHADLADGLLVIDLVREVPEAMKPKRISIGSQATLQAVEDRQAAA
jgi:molecular chaperone IbpA